MKYELMFILSPMLTEDKRKSTVKELTDMITKSGGDIFETEDWGKREFEYRIKKYDEGYYMIFYFNLEKTSFIEELDEHMRLDQAILRHMLIKRDEDFKIQDFESLMDEAKKAQVSEEKAIKDAEKASKGSRPKKEAETKKETEVEKENSNVDLDEKLADIISDSDIEL